MTRSQTEQVRAAAAAGRAVPAGEAVAGQGGAGWDIAAATQLYGIDRWGQGFFAVNEAGHVVIQPTRDPAVRIDLKQLVDDLKRRDLQPPILLRFSDILRRRLQDMAEAFHSAIREFKYQGDYRCVYPIKVNQQRHVVEEILSFGRSHGFGLEAGSKPELLAIMAMVQDTTTPIICNGFKDAQFIEGVILAGKLGRHIIPVVENFNELRLIAEYAQAHNVRPLIGMRVKLSTRGAGRWEESGGARSKFGLFVSEILEAVDYLRERDMLDCLKLLHFHLGSQINNIRQVKGAITELTRVYADLYKQGAQVAYLDVGGGLGVDYDGTKTDMESSINYTLREYANDIVFHVREVCEDADVPHPTLISESGRAMVAYHSVLILNVLGSIAFSRFQVPRDIDQAVFDALPRPVQLLYETHRDLSEKNYREYLHDAQQAHDEVMNLFSLGYCSLSDRGLAERLYYAICTRVWGYVQQQPVVHDEYKYLEPLLASTYFCNASFFQSLPDSWAIGQLFPIMPIHRLNEQPTHRGKLADITCDSDGKIDRFIDTGESKHVLELHSHDDQDYYLGVFLVGAYQEILGDLHNLFGDTHAVHVSLDEDGRPVVEEVVEGDTISEVLQYVQFHPEELRRIFRNQTEQAIRKGQLSLEEAAVLRRFYEQGLSGYTYLT